MGRSQRLRIRDMRRASELVGQVGELGANSTAWRTHALHGLIQLLDGQVGMTLDVDGALPDAIPTLIDPIDVGWTNAAARQIYYSYYQHEIVDDPGANALFATHQKVRFLTATREQLVDDKTWYASPAVSELRRAGGVDAFVSSSIAFKPGSLHGFVIYRSWGDDQFTLRHRRLLRLFHLWLFRSYKDSLQHQHEADEISALPPRVRQTFDLLIAGDSVKQIAAKLDISKHTVDDYVKTLYRRLGISSRTELLTKYLPLKAAPRLVLPPGIAPGHRNGR